MAPRICYIVPPYLLQGISASTEVPEPERKCAAESLHHRDQYAAQRRERFSALAQPRTRAAFHASHQQSIVPEILLKHVAEAEGVDEETKARAQAECEHIQHVTDQYKKSLTGALDVSAQAESAAKPKPAGFYRAVYDCEHGSTEASIPGTIKRVEGQEPNEDKVVNEAFDNAGKVLEFYLTKFNWRSIDNKNMRVVSSVHFGKNYENAFWHPELMQMVYGDGDTFLHQFTKCIDVIGHELTHAVTEHTSPLEYEGQPGALNEHISDVFGIMVKQMVEDETADKADWLIGEGCLLPGVKGVALRNMKDPGTAYDDPRFGKDPQPAHMDGYFSTVEDNGGVHLFSGIPNRAFYLASVEFGGYSWEKAGQIWWRAMNSDRIPARCTFLQFADVTTDVAEEIFGDKAAKIVRSAWNEVGVKRKN